MAAAVAATSAGKRQRRRASRSIEVSLQVVSTTTRVVVASSKSASDADIFEMLLHIPPFYGPLKSVPDDSPQILVYDILASVVGVANRLAIGTLSKRVTHTTEYGRVVRYILHDTTKKNQKKMYVFESNSSHWGFQEWEDRTVIKQIQLQLLAALQILERRALVADVLLEGSTVPDAVLQDVLVPYIDYQQQPRFS